MHTETSLMDRKKAQKRASYTAALLVIAAFFVTVGDLYLVFQRGVIGLMPQVWLTGGFFLVALAGLILIRRGRVVLGVWTQLIAIFIVVIASTFFSAGGSIIIAMIIAFLIPLMASQALPSRHVAVAIVAAIVVGILVVLIDMFGPDTRAQVPGGTVVTSAVAVPIMSVYGFIIIRQFRNYRLRTKLITATVTVAVLAVFSVTAAVTVTTRRALTEQLGHNLAALADTQALAVGELVGRQINLLETLALNHALQTAVQARNNFYEGDTPEDIAAHIAELEAQWQRAASTDRQVLIILNNSTSEELLAFRQTFPNHDNMILTDKYGGLVAASDRPEKYDFSHEPWWLDAVASGFGSVHVGEPYEDPDTGVPVIDVAVPVRTEDQIGRSAISGVLFTTFQLQALADSLRRAENDETTQVEVHFNEGFELQTLRYQGYSDTRYELRSVEAEKQAILDQLKDPEVVYVLGEVDGQSGLAALSFVTTLGAEPRVDRSGWTALVFQPEEIILAPVQRQQQVYILLGMVIITAAVIAAAVVAQLLTRPITKLTETAAQVAQGDLAARATVESQDEIGALAATFNRMTSQLQESIEGLEQRVAERTRALAASTEVSRSLSTILDLDRLAIEVVEQVQTAFGYYHAHIYLFDDEQKNLIMVGGTGEAGQVMLAQRHTLVAGQGLVGRAAASKATVFISDVTRSQEWRPNVLLPDTKAEIAVPILLRDRVLGVLDVQHDVMGGLTNEDVQLLEAIASQVAIAIQNSRLYESTQALAKQETKLNEIGQRIQQAATIESVLQVAARELVQALDIKQATVQLGKTKGHGRTNGNPRS